MNKAKWGGIAAVGVVILVVVLAVVLAVTSEYWPGAPRDSQTALQTNSGSTADAGDPGAEGDRPDDSETEPAADSALQEQAETYVKGLTAPSDEPVPMERAEAFIGADQPLSEGTAGRELEGEPETQSADIQPGTQAALTAGGETGAVSPPATTTEPAAGSDPAPSGDRKTQQTADGDAETATGVGPAPAIIDLPLNEQAPVTIAELLGPESEIPADTVFYVHTVKAENDQGIWGIVHTGILENFAEGVAMSRGEETKTYQVDIPDDADEQEADGYSSFLGRLIYEKSRQSYVYNYQTDRVGRNPDVILPGQEIVIVSFTPEELISIYKHFVRERG